MDLRVGQRDLRLKAKGIEVVGTETAFGVQCAVGERERVTGGLTVERDEKNGLRHFWVFTSKCNFVFHKLKT